jgi:hypothetical protein
MNRRVGTIGSGTPRDGAIGSFIPVSEWLWGWMFFFCFGFWITASFKDELQFRGLGKLADG